MQHINTEEYFGIKTKLRGLSPQVNYTERTPAKLVPTFADKIEEKNVFRDKH
jgi:hypothetical protein